MGKTKKKLSIIRNGGRAQDTVAQETVRKAHSGGYEQRNLNLNETPPELVHKRQNRQSNFKMGRTIGETREHLETKNERAAARKKDKRKSNIRIISTSIGFVILTAVLVILYLTFFSGAEPVVTEFTPSRSTYEPTIEIIDEDASATDGKITSRMREYIGQAEADFKDLGYSPTKAILPTGTIRTIYFYLEGYPGFIKMTIDRGSAVSVEDADRMIRYLSGQGITDFQYIDVRIDRRAYWQ